MDIRVDALAIDPTTPTTLYAGAGSRVYKSTDSGGTWTSVACGATSSTLAVDPTDSNLVYLGGGMGITRSSNAGQHWTHSGPTVLVKAIAADPTTPGTVYVGSVAGAPAVSKSTDSGATWFSVEAGLTNTGVEALGIDPTNHGVLYAGTARGIFKTADEGATWRPIGLADNDYWLPFIEWQLVSPSNGGERPFCRGVGS
jgi:photosystem II stability/assembly factor-like uncharacterized protein